MKTIILTIFMGLIVIGCSDAGSLRFGDVVKIDGIEGYDLCVGMVRNPLVFDYYHVDKLWCDKMSPGRLTSLIVKDQIFSGKQLKFLFKEDSFRISPTPTGISYVPLCNSYDGNSKYYRENGEWKKVVQPVAH